MCHMPKPERFYSRCVQRCDTCINKQHRRLAREEELQKQWENEHGVGAQRPSDPQHGGARPEADPPIRDRRALDDTIRVIEVNNTAAYEADPLLYFKQNEERILAILTNALKDLGAIKWHAVILVRFSKMNEFGELVRVEHHIRCNSRTATVQINLVEQIAEAFQQLYLIINDFNTLGSGWNLEAILGFELGVGKYSPLTGNSYFRLPADLAKKKAIINVQNHDNKCFLYAVCAGLMIKRNLPHPERVAHYHALAKTLKCDMLTHPTPLSQIPKFERSNNVSINVFGYEDKVIFPLLNTKHRDMPRHLNLLLISHHEKRHFCLIKNMSRLISSRTKHKGRCFLCNYCMHVFSNARVLEEHGEYCHPDCPQKLTFPHEDNLFIQFKNHCNALRVPFVIYADFECILTKIATCAPDSANSSTEKYQKHEASGFTIYTVCADPDAYYMEPITYRGDNASDIFIMRLKEIETQIKTVLLHVVPANPTLAEFRQFAEAEVCHICGKDLTNDKVLNHCHLTGSYLGAAHNSCNLNFKYHKLNERKPGSFMIPVILHNLRGYDSHLIMSSLGKVGYGKLTCLANNLQKYISFSCGTLRFIDSAQFLASSLATLVENLAKGGVDNFPNLSYHCDTQAQINMLMRKGIYPYDYIDSAERFKETCLPPIASFDNRLNGESISAEDYHFAQEVWRLFDLKNLGDYHDLYMTCDVLLLADVFEDFRNRCMRFYGLDPAHYYTSAGYSWDSMLKKTQVELELINDIDMHLFVEQGMRGGVSMITTKFAEANNIHMSTYDPEKPSSFLLSLDMNNLYGFCMMEALPQSDFTWLSTLEIADFDVNDIPDDGDVGYFLEVDLSYGAELHAMHSALPMAPERMVVTDQMLSPHSRQLKENLQLKFKPCSKLVPNLQDKEKYVVHYRNLKYYIAQGMVVTKIHRVIQFSQAPWLRPYIDFNTDQRKKATNEVDKNLYKLMNNSIYGKSCENVKRRMNVELVNSPRRMRKLLAKPSFYTFKIFHEKLAAVHLRTVKVVLNKPSYVGFSVLDLSKLHMYKFHYDYMLGKYDVANLKLLFTDTDSLTYQIFTEDVYRDMAQDNCMFDTSNYPPDHPLFSLARAQQVGLMKDELASKIGVSFCGLRSKMYSLLYAQPSGTLCEKNVAKGVCRSAIKRKLRHELYVRCLNQGMQIRTQMRTIRSYDHQLYSICMNKVSLSPFDDKRFVLANGIDTLAHGHYLATPDID